MVAYFHSTGKAVSLDDLEAWLRLFFWPFGTIWTDSTRRLERILRVNIADGGVT
jgi:hypothetical protein